MVSVKEHKYPEFTTNQPRPKVKAWTKTIQVADDKQLAELRRLAVQLTWTATDPKVHQLAVGNLLLANVIRVEREQAVHLRYENFELRAELRHRVSGHTTLASSSLSCHRDAPSVCRADDENSTADPDTKVNTSWFSCLKRRFLCLVKKGYPGADRNV